MVFFNSENYGFFLNEEKKFFLMVFFFLKTMKMEKYKQMKVSTLKNLARERDVFAGILNLENLS